MKIARIIGPEDVRNAQTQVHSGGAAPMIPFAESFNESMTATAITPGDFLKQLPDGDATLQGKEGLKQSSGEHASMAHLFEEALTGISAGSKKGLPNEETGASRSGETSSGEEAALKDRAKELVTKASVKVETSEVGLDGNQASQPSVAEQKDAGEADEGSANTNNAPSFDAELKDALPAGVAQGMSQEKVQRAKRRSPIERDGKDSPRGSAAQSFEERRRDWWDGGCFGTGDAGNDAGGYICSCSFAGSCNSLFR